MDERDWLADRFRGTPDASASGGLSDARFAERGGRRGPGSLAAAEPHERKRDREPRRLADDRRRARLAEHAPLTQSKTRGPARLPRARADRRSRRRHGPRARGASGGLRRPGPARRTGDAVSTRAARVRAPRHLRRALRRDRTDRRSHAGGDTPARQPRAPSGPGRAEVSDADLATQREVVDAFLAASRDGDFQGLLEVLDPDVVLRADPGALAGGLREVRGARAVAGRALFYSRYSRLGLLVKPALVNGAFGAVATRDAELYAVLGVTVRGGRIVEIDILADPDRLPQLDLTILGG